MNTVVRKYLQGDMVIWAVVFLLSLISVMAVFSATNNLAHYEKGVRAHVLRANVRMFGNTPVNVCICKLHALFAN